MTRKFTDLVPQAQSVRKRLRQALSGSAIAGIGLSAPHPAEPSEVTATALETPSVTIVNKVDKAKKLILQLPSGASYKLLQHRSHSSHSSHSSHASHYSGTSAAPATPAPTPKTSTPPPRTAETVPTVADPAQLFFNGTIDTINKDARTIIVKRLETGLPYTLSYRDDTMIRSLDGDESRLDEEMEKRNGTLPFSKGQKVQVHWKEGTNGKSIVVTIAHIK